MTPRWPLLVWALLVLLGHWAAWSGWRAALLGAQALAPPIERLAIELRRPVQARPAAPAERVLQPRQGEAAARVAPATTAPRPPDGPSAPEEKSRPREPAPEPAPEPSPEPSPEAAPAAESASAPLGAPQALGVEAGAEWPRSLRLRYRLTGHYRGPVHGDAEVEWLRQGLHYQVRLRVQVGPSLTPFVRRELVSDGVITPDGIRPRRYDESTQLLLMPSRRAALRFEPGHVQGADGSWHDAPDGVQDSASQFAHLAWLFLTGRAQAQEGELVALPLALPRGVHPWRYRVQERQGLESVIGVLSTWHLVPHEVTAPGALMAEVWLAADLQFMPVQLLIRQGEENWVELSLAEAPLEEDAAPQNAASQPASETP